MGLNLVNTVVAGVFGHNFDISCKIRLFLGMFLHKPFIVTEGCSKQMSPVMHVESLLNWEIHMYPDDSIKDTSRAQKIQ